MNDSITHLLPVFYRLDLSQDLSLHVEQGVSFNLIGIPAVGKTSYLEFFIHNLHSYIIDDIEREFITINLRAYYGKSLDDFLMYLIDKLDIEGDIKPKQAWDALEDYSEGRELFFIVRYLDELDQEAIDHVLEFCLITRDNPYKYNFIFISRKPLFNILSDNAVINSRLFGTQEYFVPDSSQELWIKLDKYSQLLSLDIDNTTRFKIHQLSGGHGGYLQSIIFYEKKGELEEAIKEFPNDFISRSEEIMDIFSENEKEVLNNIAKNPTEINLKTVPPLLIKTGIVRFKDDHPYIFAQILERYLQER